MDSEGNFSDHLNTALKIAREAARQYRTSYIGSEHILLGILSIPECAAYQPLSEEGVTYEGYVRYFKRILDHDAKLEGYTPNTKRMFELAVQYSMVDGAFKPLAGTEHMLLAILCVEDSTACRILAGLGVKLEKYRARFRTRLQHDSPIQGFTPRMTKVFISAREFSLLSKEVNPIIGTEHVLMAILTKKGGLGKELLEGLGVDLAELAKRTEVFLGAPRADEKGEEDAQKEIQPISLARGIGKDEDDGCKEGDDGEHDENDLERLEGAQLLARLFRFRRFLVVSRDGRLVLFGVDARTLHERVEVLLRVAFYGAF